MAASTGALRALRRLRPVRLDPALSSSSCKVRYSILCATKRHGDRIAPKKNDTLHFPLQVPAAAAAAGSLLGAPRAILSPPSAPSLFRCYRSEVKIAACSCLCVSPPIFADRSRRAALLGACRRLPLGCAPRGPGLTALSAVHAPPLLERGKVCNLLLMRASLCLLSLIEVADPIVRGLPPPSLPRNAWRCTLFSW